jgi:hypothetical protein
MELDSRVVGEYWAGNSSLNELCDTNGIFDCMELLGEGIYCGPPPARGSENAFGDNIVGLLRTAVCCIGVFEAEIDDFTLPAEGERGNDCAVESKLL